MSLALRQRCCPQRVVTSLEHRNKSRMLPLSQENGISETLFSRAKGREARRHIPGRASAHGPVWAPY